MESDERLRFRKSLNFVKQETFPGCIVSIKDPRESERIDEKLFVVVEIYPNYVLCKDVNGLIDCFLWFDIAKAYETGNFFRI